MIKVLYQFKPINRYTIMNLLNQQDWAADPKKFNDPFELAKHPWIKVSASGDLTVSDLSADYLDELDKKSSEFGLSCYSENNYLDTLMWAYYGQQHQGICLEFEIPSSSTTLRKVAYKNELPKLLEDTRKGNTRKNLFKIATTKSKAWKHEKEWRQIVESKNCPIDYPGILKKVIFGCRTTYQDVKCIIEIMKQINNRKVEINRVKQMSDLTLQLDQKKLSNERPEELRIKWVLK